jgi:hypothetical protein
MKGNFERYKDKNFEDNIKINYENKELLPSKKLNSKNDYFNNLNAINNNKDVIYLNNDSNNSVLSKFKSSKLFGITFYYIGNLYAFNIFNNYFEPSFCVDTLINYNIIIYFIDFFLALLGNYYVYGKVKKWKQIIFNILLFITFIIYNILIILNPGIVIYSKKVDQHSLYCSICNIYYLPEDNISHCSECNVCVKDIDHHCLILRKCITKKNFIFFVLLIVSIVILYSFCLINLFLFIKEYNKKK